MTESHYYNSCKLSHCSDRDSWNCKHQTGILTPMTESYWCEKTHCQDVFLHCFQCTDHYMGILVRLQWTFLSVKHMITKSLDKYFSATEFWATESWLNAWMQQFLMKSISKGSAVSHLRCGEIFPNQLLQIYTWVQQWKNSENQLRFDKSYSNKFGIFPFWKIVYIHV